MKHKVIKLIYLEVRGKNSVEISYFFLGLGKKFSRNIKSTKNLLFFFKFPRRIKFHSISNSVEMKIP